MNALGLVAGGIALVGVGIHIGHKMALVQTERDLRELRESIPKVWDAGVAAARQMCQHHHDADDGIQVWAMSPEFVEQLRSNRRHN